MLLEQWQDRLELHFQSLAQARAESDFPIFALEHNLRDEELDEISSLLCSRVKSGLPLNPHWLLWVIYATERGYSYAGDEYWHSFEEVTPGWDSSNREDIRTSFKKFQKAYRGVVPSGPWAEHFSIIAWPITHAILPRYLQRQFAKLLYEIRFRLASINTTDASKIGRLLTANAHYASTRFEEFLEQEELTGRIVLALLGTQPLEGRELIYQPTLARIVRDLEKVRSARDWLKETQRVVADRFRGIGQGTTTNKPTTFTGLSDPQPSAHLDIRPDLLLRHSGGGKWSVLLRVPSFGSVALIAPDLRAFLQRTRCRLNGGTDFKPPGWLVSGNRMGVLTSWPNVSKPLIQFEHSNPVLNHLLESECRLTSAAPWLFRIGEDGLALQIVGRIVRPGRSYIVVTNADLPQSDPCMSPCTLDCSGVKSFHLKIPDQVSAEATAWLQGFGLQVARTIRVWPAGLPGRGWDGEGQTEWLTTEAPCFGIAHDHPIDAYELQLNNSSKVVIKAGDAGRPQFVCLAPLPAGSHLLTIKARRGTLLDSIAPSSAAQGFVHLNVREPEAWTPGVASHPGLIITVDPPNNDLDAFWRNALRLSVMGPATYSATFTLSLQARDGHEFLSEQVGNPIELPVTPEVWHQRFAQFSKREELQWSYLDAASCYLKIAGESLGETSLKFEHKVQPLRWVLKRDHKNIIARLVDDTGKEGPGPEIMHFSMNNPVVVRRYGGDEALRGLIVESPGGLFYAKREPYSSSVIVSTGLSAKGFGELSVSPQFPNLQKQLARVPGVLRSLQVWSIARQYGSLASIRRGQVIDAIIIAIYGALCGSHWANAESKFKKSGGSQTAIDNLQRSVRKNPSFASVLRQDFSKVDGGSANGLNWFIDVASRYQVTSDRRLCEFALRAASEPHNLRRLFGKQLESLLQKIAASPTILRGARLLVLLSANSDREGKALRLLPRWKS